MSAERKRYLRVLVKALKNFMFTMCLSFLFFSNCARFFQSYDSKKNFADNCEIKYFSFFYHKYNLFISKKEVM